MALIHLGLLLLLVRASAARPKHFIVALVDDLGGYNVPWRNPQQRMADDLVQLSGAEGMTLEAFYTYKFCSPTRASFLSARFAPHVNEKNPGGSPDKGGVDLRMALLPQKLKQTQPQPMRSYMAGKVGHRKQALLAATRACPPPHPPPPSRTYIGSSHPYVFHVYSKCPFSRSPIQTPLLGLREHPSRQEAPSREGVSWIQQGSGRVGSWRVRWNLGGGGTRKGHFC